MTWLIAFIAKSALAQSPIGSFFKMVPAGAWKIIGALVIAATLYFAHQHVAGKKLKAADAAGYSRAKQEDAAALAKVRQQALDLKTKAEALGASIAHTTRSENDAENARIDRTASDLLRTGPGKAGCGRLDYPAVPAAGSGHEPTAEPTGPAVAGVPDPRGSSLIALPFSATIAAARQCDADRAEVIAWRQWYDKQSAAWPVH